MLNDLRHYMKENIVCYINLTGGILQILRTNDLVQGLIESYLEIQV